MIVLVGISNTQMGVQQNLHTHLGIKIHLHSF